MSDYFKVDGFNLLALGKGEEGLDRKGADTENSGEKKLMYIYFRQGIKHV